MRPDMADILQRSRTGDCTTDDIVEIRKLVLGNPECNIPDFTHPPWSDAILITPRNAVRTLWNNAMLKSFCRRTGHIRYVLYAYDTLNTSL